MGTLLFINVLTTFGWNCFISQLFFFFFKVLELKNSILCGELVIIKCPCFCYVVKLKKYCHFDLKFNCLFCYVQKCKLFLVVLVGNTVKHTSTVQSPNGKNR